MGKPTPRTVLKAVVSDLRTELNLINPDYRRVGRMVADGLEALLDRAEAMPELVEVRTPDPVELRTRNPKTIAPRRKDAKE